MRAVVSVLGVQKPSVRFGRNIGREEFPQIAPWRCNLSGLSQRNNLLFMAYTGYIYVYEPHFPSQALPSKPALIIDTPPSAPGLTGMLDPRYPRAINSLVVQDLGIEEILAVARDDGDVEAYLVAHVVHAVERCAAGEVAEVRPFFQSNVMLSAWGLAVHSNARILAVSSNTHNVTVFKFGLVDASGNDECYGESAERRDAVEVIINGTTNIPYISFCNTGDDPAGRWLLTTDIVGRTRAIDLRDMRLAQAFSFVSANSWQMLHDRQHAGWTAMFLDRGSFIEEPHFESALGKGYAMTANDQIWDLGRTVSFRVPDSGSNFVFHNNNHTAAEIDQRSTTRTNSESETTEDDEPPSSPYHDEHDEDVSDTSSEADNSSSTWTMLGSTPKKQHPTAPFCADLPCPIFHTSVKNAYLLQPGEGGGPVVGFSDILYQYVQPSYRALNMFDRLNLSAYIPSLGILVLASQKGRAVVLALTKVRYFDPERWTYAMRVECILPFAEQERRNERPFAPLMGITVGPVQGTEVVRGERRDGNGLRRRWRLMMCYYDHSVLSYEVGRGGEQDCGVKVEKVVV